MGVGVVFVGEDCQWGVGVVFVGEDWRVEGDCVGGKK